MSGVVKFGISLDSDLLKRFDSRIQKEVIQTALKP